MKTITINFTCPSCGEQQLSQLRERVEVMERLGGILVMGKESPGRKYNPDLTGSRTETEGKVVGFVCESCGYRLTRMVTPRRDWSPWAQRQKLKAQKVAIKSPLDLYRWLKKHKMIHEKATN